MLFVSQRILGQMVTSRTWIMINAASVFCSVCFCWQQSGSRTAFNFGCYSAWITMGNLCVLHNLLTLAPNKLSSKTGGAAKLLAASNSMDNWKVICKLATLLFRIAVEVTRFVDSKHLSRFLSTQSNSIERFILPIVDTIRFEYESGGVDEVLLLPWSSNLGHPETKTDSPSLTPLQLLTYDVIILSDMSQAELQRRHPSWGTPLESIFERCWVSKISQQRCSSKTKWKPHRESSS